MLEPFTHAARQVVVLAQDEARALKHNYIGTEHILLGLLREESLAARVLGSLDIRVDEVRAQVARIVGHGDEPPFGQIPFTPRTKKMLQLAVGEAQSLGQEPIGPEHILLALTSEGQGVAARILDDFDAGADKIRVEMMRLLGWTSYAPGAEWKEKPRWSPRPYRLVYPRGHSATLAAAFLLGAAVFAGGLLAGWLIWG